MIFCDTSVDLVLSNAWSRSSSLRFSLLAMALFFLNFSSSFRKLIIRERLSASFTAASWLSKLASAINVAGDWRFDSSPTKERLWTDNGLIWLLLLVSELISTVKAALAAAVLSPPLKISLIPSRPEHGLLQQLLNWDYSSMILTPNNPFTSCSDCWIKFLH